MLIKTKNEGLQNYFFFFVSGDGTAFEVGDLEFHQIDKRLVKLEEVYNCNYFKYAVFLKMNFNQQMMGEVHKNEVRKSEVEDLHKNFGKLTKDVSFLQTKIKYAVRSPEHLTFLTE